MQLSDEYQVTEHIFQPCVEFLEDKRKTKENVMQILALAELYDLEEVREDCNKLLCCLKLETLSETVQFENVGKDELEHFLTQRIDWNVVCGCGVMRKIGAWNFVQLISAAEERIAILIGISRNVRLVKKCFVIWLHIPSLTIGLLTMVKLIAIPPRPIVIILTNVCQM